MSTKRELAGVEISLEAFRENQAGDFAKLSGLIRIHGETGRFVWAVGQIGYLGSGSMLSLAMLEWLIEENPEATRKYLMQAAGVIPRLAEPALPGTSGPAGRPVIDAALEVFRPLTGIHRRNAALDMRDGPFCMLAAAVLTNTLSQHLPLLRRLAPMIREHNDDDYSSLDALGLLAFATGDEALRQAFEYRVQRYLKAKWLLGFFKGTMIQIQALLARDQAALDAATEQTAAEFLLRAKDKKTLGQRQGLGMYSHFEFDLRGTTVGKLARMNGLRFEHDSRAIPLGVVRMFE